MKFLASVTGPDEAEIVIECGADFVDLKDPSKGSLGAVAPAVLAQTVKRVAGRCPVSAVAGDLPMDPEIVRREVEARAGADFVKIGLFPAERETRLAVIQALANLPGKVRPIAVFFADGDPDFSLLEHLKQAGFAGAMIDTIGKDGSRLLSHLPVRELGDFVERLKALNMMSGLAGSLEAADIPRLAPIAPDYLGFRGALTSGARAADIDPARVRSVRAMISGGAALARDEAARRQGRSDRIFVENFTLPMEIGAYGFEKGRTQKVRFSVDAAIDPIQSGASTIGDVYSYDVILDAIRTLAARGHSELVESLALDLADTILADDRIREVTVKVEKLELGPEAVGVSITRGRP